MKQVFKTAFYRFFLCPIGIHKNKKLNNNIKICIYCLEVKD